jgi:hypothetical protein
MSEALCETQVQEAFLAAGPLIAQQIQDLTIKHPTWMRDLYDVDEWPRGSGRQMQQLVFRGAMPKIERGFDKWKKAPDNAGCNPGEGADCSYNWSNFGGTSFERKITDLMSRDFKSPEYCIKEIQTTANFMEVFSKIVENLFAQVNFFKEMNIGHNFLTALAKKFVVDSGGAKGNVHNPYVYRNAGTRILSALNIGMLEFFYEQLRRMPDAVPYDVVDGAPLYSLMASHQLLSRLYRDDAALRQDVRFSSMANDLLSKYNFMSTIRGMFIAAPIMYPRRFNLVAVTGEPIEVLPFLNDVPAEVGSYTDLSPAYEAATHEEVLIHGRAPFKIFHLPTEQTLGHNTSFGPEDSFLNNWNWINPLTNCDPFRRNGYFASSAEIGLSQQHSEGVFGILVERPSVQLMFMQNPLPVAPVTPAVPTNIVPTVTCPCPLILDVYPNRVLANRWQFTFASQVSGAIDSAVQLGLDNGGYVNGTLKALSSDNYTAEILLPATFDESAIGNIIGIYCDGTLGCSARVIAARDCRSGETGEVELVLSNPIKADTAGDLITVCLGNGNTTTLEILAVDMVTLTYTVAYAAGFGPTDDPTGAGETALLDGFLCDTEGVIKVCVPTATDATCPACETEPTPCSGAQA